MKRYLMFSGISHGLLFAAFLSLGSLLTRPRMSYYAVDLVASSPAGASGVAMQPQPTPAPVQAAKPVALPPAVEEKAPPPLKESIRVKGKVVRPHPAQPPAPVPEKKKKLIIPSKYLGGQLDIGNGRGSNTSGVAAGSGVGGSAGAGIVADAGPAFPYPWYLKAIADRLDQKWHPPQEFQSDTLCQVAFTIHRSGEVSDSKIEKPSGDSTFDQLALRAVMYANPLPPLPDGFPDDALHVHMKFVGKPY